MPYRLNHCRDGERDREREEEPLPGLLLERLAAEVAEQDGVGAPDRACERVEADEAMPGEAVDEAGGERRHRPPAGDEPGDDDQVAAAFLEELPRPLDPLLRLLALEEAPVQPLAEEVPARERDVVSDDRSERRRDDHELDAQA